MSTRLSNFASALLGALTVAVVVVALALAGVLDSDPATPTAPASVPTATTEEAGSGDESAASPQPATASTVADVYERANPGVVDVQVGAPPTPSALGGGGGGGQGGATGSGFVIDDDGYIVTNQHVVEDAETATIRFAGRDRQVRARVVGTDASTDLALLKVDPREAGDLTPLPLGSSEAVRVGEQTIALGSPFGLEGTLTTGVVSAKDRPIPATNGFTIEGAIQTDAAINPGNSGGPLLDARGRVIGVNAQIRTEGGANSGVGFAIAVDTVKEIVPELRRDGEVERPYLGVSTGETPNGQGVLVARVQSGDPADEAGLEVGDVITGIAGTRTNDPSDVASAISDKRIGERIEITYRRGGQERTATVTLAERPQEVQVG